MSKRCFPPIDLLSGQKIDLLDDTTFTSLKRLCVRPAWLVLLVPRLRVQLSVREVLLRSDTAVWP